MQAPHCHGGRKLHGKPNCGEVWRKPISSLIHKVAMTPREGGATPGANTQLAGERGGGGGEEGVTSHGHFLRN